MTLRSTLLSATLLVHLGHAGPALAQRDLPPPPAADAAMPYYDRHLIDIANLRYFYEGSLMADAMLHGPGMFAQTTKWHLTLYQMILSDSGHHQARSAYQLSLMGVPMAEILATWSPGFVDTVQDPRTQAPHALSLGYRRRLPTAHRSATGFRVCHPRT